MPVTTSELKMMIDQLRLVPNVSNGGVASEPWVSISLSNPELNPSVFEAILARADASQLFQALHEGLVENQAQGRRKLSQMSCAVGGTTGSFSDTSDDVEVTWSEETLNHTINQYERTITLTNRGKSSLVGSSFAIVALSLDVDHTSFVDILNADGVSCSVAPVGQDFVYLNSDFAPNASVDLVIRYKKPPHVAADFPTRIDLIKILQPSSNNQ